MCRWHATYHWKELNKGYNFASNLTSIEGLHTKLWASKIIGGPILEISRLPLGSFGTKWHLGVGPMARHKEYYNGEGGGFPQVRTMVSLVCSCLTVTRSCTKSAPILHLFHFVSVCAHTLKNWVEVVTYNGRPTP
jgi:hypothetical protein